MWCSRTSVNSRGSTSLPILSVHNEHDSTTKPAICVCSPEFRPLLFEKAEQGAVRRIRTRLTMTIICRIYAVQSFCHSTRAASRWLLNVSLEFRCRSLLKWLKMEEWIETNFCKLRMCRKRSIAYSRRRNGRWEFSHLLFFHRPTSWSAWFPLIFMAAL